MFSLPGECVLEYNFASEEKYPFLVDKGTGSFLYPHIYAKGERRVTIREGSEVLIACPGPGNSLGQENQQFLDVTCHNSNLTRTEVRSNYDILVLSRRYIKLSYLYHCYHHLQKWYYYYFLKIITIFFIILLFLLLFIYLSIYLYNNHHSYCHDFPYFSTVGIKY